MVLQSIPLHHETSLHNSCPGLASFQLDDAMQLFCHVSGLDDIGSSGHTQAAHYHFFEKKTGLNLIWGLFKR